MKTAFILAFILLLLSFHSNAQQTIDKLNVNQLKLPKESANKALILDGAGQVKSSSTITDTELGYLEGLSDTLVNLLSGKANDSDVVKLSGNQSVDGVKTFTGKLVASSTVNGSIPCPVMTEAQRDLFTPVEGDCVYNSDTLKLNVFDGSVWKDVGGAGGISLWLTANPYNVNDIVIESDKIYRCLIAHTSGTFATDLGSGNWGEVSQGLTSPVALADGGTGLSITPVAGSIVYVDADSFEQLAPGASGQVLQSNGSSAPSWVNKSISAKSENGSSVTAEELQVSNNQLTQVDTNKHLIESGNNNLLINPSFEHSTFSTGWTNSVGTFTEETVVEIHGKKAAKLVLSSQTMALTQDSSLYAAQFADGVQGLASVRIKSDIALKVCSRSAGVTSSSLCVDVQANNKWGLYKVPFILGATSNGISIASTGAVSGTVYIDDAFVGAVDLSATQSFDTTCDTIDCATEFSIKISSGGVVSAESGFDWISGNCTSASAMVCTINSGVFNLAPNCNVSVNDTTLGRESHVNSQTSTSFTITRQVSGTTTTSTDFGVTVRCQKQGSDYTAALQAQKDFEKSKVSSYSSTNADTDWASCNFSTLAWQGAGNVSSVNLQCKRNGEDLLIRGNFTTGIVSASEVRLPLPVWNGSALLTSNSSKIAVTQMVGQWTQAASNIYMGTILVQPSVSYLNFGISGAVNQGTSIQTGTAIFGSSVNTSINARIPIEGWQNSNILIGQFNGLESCSSTLDCTDTFSAKVSAAGVVSDENVTDFINGNCTNPSAGNFTCTFGTGVFSVTPNCSVTPIDNQASYWEARIISAGSTSSALQYQTGASTGTGSFLASNGVRIICQKQGVDYIGKTAKAVASDQNLRVPGLTKVAIYQASISAADVVTDENADWINGDCTNATTGQSTCNLNANIFSSAPKCWVSKNQTVGANAPVSCDFLATPTASTVSNFCKDSAGASLNVPFNLFCMGVTP